MMFEHLTPSMFSGSKLINSFVTIFVFASIMGILEMAKSIFVQEFLSNIHRHEQNGEGNLGEVYKMVQSVTSTWQLKL